MRVARFGAAAAAFTVVLAGCTGTTEQADATPTPVATTPTASPTISSAPEASALADAPFTEPGATVPLGDTLVLPVSASNTDGEATELKVQIALDGLDTAALDDIADYLSPADVEGMTGWYYPAYVTLTLTMVGQTVPDSFAITDAPSFNGVTATGGQVSPPLLTGTPESCTPLDATELTQTGTTTGCVTLMVNEGTELTALQYRGNFHGSAANYTATPVTWEIAG